MVMFSELWRMTGNRATVALPTPLKYGAVPNPCNHRPPVNCSKEERLILMASSDGKADLGPEQRVAPINLYTGVMFVTLKERLVDLDQIRIIILSAKHGLVGKEWPKIAPYYARPLTQKKAERLIENGLDKPFDDWGRLRPGRCGGPSPRQLLKPYSGSRWHDIFITAGGEYRQVFHAFVTQLIEIGAVTPKASINETEGGADERRRQFGQYLQVIA
jgi:hypothetical protein